MADRSDFKREEEEEEDDEELGEMDYKAQKDALIFAIDVSSSMLQLPPHSDDKKADKDAAVIAALKCANQLMQQRIISNPKDMMGIMFFGTQKTKFREGDGQRSALGYPNCYVFTDLDVPSADDVKALKELLEEDSEEASEILVPADERVSMSSVLFCANQIFTTKAPNFGSRRLFIVTDNDDPHANDKKSKEAAATRAKDLYDLGVTIDLFAVIRGDSKFDLTKFYDDIIYRDPTSEETNPDRVSNAKSGDGITLMNSLVANINSKQTPKRAYFSNMPLELGPGLTISVKGYIILQKQQPARSCYVWLDGEKAQIAVGETARIAEDSARTVETGEVKKAYKFGGEYVYFSEEEQKSIKEFGGATIRIIGFKDRSLLKFWHAVKKSTFIFPSEEGFVGSTRVFSALWRKLIKSQKIGIAWHIARKNGNPQLVAIVPSRPPNDEATGIDAIPAGLWLVPIPFADDVREGPDGMTGRLRTTDELTTKMHAVIRQLQLPAASFNPLKYPNPALQWHYRILQALALEDEVPEQPDDATVPKYRAIHKRCGGYIQDWSATADEVLGRIQDRQSVKRELEDDDAAPRAKKTKAASSTGPKGGDSGASSDAVLKKRYKDGNLSKLTVAELKTVLVDRGIEPKGLKKDLVERVEQWAEDNL